MEVLFIVIPVMIVGYFKWKKEDREIAEGKRRAAPPSKNLADFMFYHYDDTPMDFKK